MTPAYRINLAGKAVTQDWKFYIVSISVTDQADSKQADSCSIVLQDADAELVMPEPGVEIELFLGYDKDEPMDEERIRSVGKYLIDSVSVSGPPNTITIEGKSAIFASNVFNKENMQTKRNRTHSNTTLGALVGKIAGENDITAEVDQEVALTDLGTIQQTDQTDMDMIGRICEKLGLVYKFADSRLIVVKPGNAVVGDAPQFTVNLFDSKSWSYKRSERPKYKSCVATYHDVDLGQPFDVSYGEGTPVQRMRDIYKNQADALNAARAFVDEALNAGVTLSVAMAGRSDLCAGGRAYLMNFPYDLRKLWLITEVKHSLSSGGYTTDISAKPFIV